MDYSQRVRIGCLAAMLGMVCAGPARAAEKLRWDELEFRVRPMQTWRADVSTVDGQKRWAVQVAVKGDYLEFYDQHGDEQKIARSNVAKVKFMRPLRLGKALAHGGGFPFKAACDHGARVHEGACSPTVFVLTTPAWGFTAASAPFLLLGDGIGRLAGPIEFEVLR